MWCDAQESSRTVLAPIVSVGVDFLPQDLHVLPGGPAVQLVDPDLLSTQVVRVPRVVLDVKPEISRALLRFLHGGEGARREESRERHEMKTDGPEERERENEGGEGERRRLKEKERARSSWHRC